MRSMLRNFHVTCWAHDEKMDRQSPSTSLLVMQRRRRKITHGLTNVFAKHDLTTLIASHCMLLMKT